MSIRSRPRHSAALIEPDAEEERTIWSAIQATLRIVRDAHAQAEEISSQIMEMEAELKDREDHDGNSLTVEEITSLQDLYRQGIKVAEEEHRILKEEGIVDNVDVLMALRDAPSRPSLPPLPTHPKVTSRPKRKLEDLAVEIPGRPSSPLTPGLGSRLKSASGNLSGRSASIPIKMEVDTTPNTPLSEYSKLGYEMAARLNVNAEIAFRPKGSKPSETDWILCTILSVKGDGPRRQLRIQDAEDENGKPGRRYDQKFSPNNFITIPPPDVDIKTLPEYTKGQKVLARYPDTTCFYQAEIVRKTNNGKYTLKFEGETEENKETQVDRRYVLEPPMR